MHRFQRSQINTGGWIQADRSNQTDREPRMPGLTSNQWQVSIPSLRSPLCRMLDPIFCDVVHPVRAWMCGDRTAGARWKWWFNQLKNRAKSLSRLTNRRNEGKNRSLDTMFQRPARGWVYSAGSNVAEEQTPGHAAKKRLRRPPLQLLMQIQTNQILLPTEIVYFYSAPPVWFFSALNTWVVPRRAK